MRNRPLVMVLAVFLVSCLPTPATQLVRDGAGMFDPAALAQAEERLQAIARRTDVWVLVITGDNPDTPRLVQEPMRQAEARGAEVYALILTPQMLVGTSGNVYTADGGFTPFPYDGVEGLLARGHPDEALAKIVETAEAFADDPDAFATPPPVHVPVDEAGSSG